MIGMLLLNAFLYGDCRPLSDTGYFVCRTPNGRIVYVDREPSFDVEKRFKRARARFKR